MRVVMARRTGRIVMGVLIAAGLSLGPARPASAAVTATFSAGILTVTGDAAAGPDAPRLADRLFLGYQPAAAVIEVISYDEAAGRFAFEEVVGYGRDGARLEPAEMRVCLPCHQGRGPIFSRPLWSESNAEPEIAARLAGLGESFHGAPVRQTVDGLAAFDAAIDRAAEADAANRLWSAGCGDADRTAATSAIRQTAAVRRLEQFIGRVAERVSL